MLLSSYNFKYVWCHSAYLIYNPDSEEGASDGTKFGDAVINALVIVSFFLVATFVIVCCYKFNFNRVRLETLLLNGFCLQSSHLPICSPVALFAFFVILNRSSLGT